MNGRLKKIRGASSVIGILALTGSLGFGVMGTAVSAGAAPRPASNSNLANTPANYKNKLSVNTKGWCNNPLDAPCDGAANHYGTIDIVKHGFSNNGGYAASVPGPGGQAKY